MSSFRLLAVLNIGAEAMSPGMATRQVWRRAPPQEQPTGSPG